MRTVLLMILALGLAGCAVAPQRIPTSVPTTGPTTPNVATPPWQSGEMVARNFIQVIETVEPVAERECRARTRGVSCDFQIVVDDRRDQPPNAFQTLGENGRPIIGFTLTLIAEARNVDELAFILGHEAAHHIAGHIPKSQQSALGGAILAGVLASVSGADAAGVREAQNIGASLAARRFSKDFELEADALGAVIAAAAGYDPVRGVEYFARAPDPGNRFLGTHPPNAERIALVRRIAAGL